MTAAAAPQPRRRGIDPAAAAAALRGVTRERADRYAAYWRRCRPRTPEAVWSRWVYAYASVNRNFFAHLQLFRYLARFRPGFSATVTAKAFAARVRRSGEGGMYGVTARGVWEFDRDFTADPARFCVRRAGTAERDRLMATLHGLGRAKTAFALELIDPIGCRTVCGDRHFLRMFGFDPKTPVSDEDYGSAEAWWVDACRDRRLSPAVARFVAWDLMQGQVNCRYWSSCFEPWVDVAAWAKHSDLRW